MDFDYTQATAQGVGSEVDAAIATATGIIESVVGGGERTWEGTIGSLEDVAGLMAETFGRTGFMGYVHPDEEIREAGKGAEERLSKFGIELAFRRDLYEAVADFASSEEARRLGRVEARLLEFTMRDFRDAGHELDTADRDRLRQLSDRLVEIGISFQRNIAENDDALIVTAADLEGMPASYIESLDHGEEEDTFRITLAYPHVIPFLDNSPQRHLREALSKKFNSQAADENRALLEEAVAIRHEIAGLFGLSSWAHKVLEHRMAESPEAVARFYEELEEPLVAAAQTEKERMAALLAADTGDTTLMQYDTRYYDTLIRRTEYGVDQHVVAEYFPLDSVLQGLFGLTGDVFGLTYHEVDVETWHPDVRTFAIHDAADSRLVSHFSMDLFPRAGKYSHAAAFSLIPGRRLADGSYQVPYAAIVANFTKPTASRPSLLQHSEVETFFHEFGHILHQTLTTAPYVRFAGTSVERDFVEAPSQIMQHWTWNADVLSTFARHHETGEPISPELVDQLVAARLLNVALDKLRQMTYGMLDQEVHGPAEVKDLDDILARTWAITQFPFHEGTFYPASFGHLFGYDAGYYGYLWSEVYGDDMFSRFEEEGLLSPAVGRAYRREVLEPGGTRSGMDHLQAFLGRAPDSAAFLRKLGIA
ncbi:MAG TPA: M3 family metallopeptidase [Acidimicrobiia bacterium]|nr:M3 family metallopeptidase [Acidimicrobiia bacterium]